MNLFHPQVGATQFFVTINRCLGSSYFDER